MFRMALAAFLLTCAPVSAFADQLIVRIGRVGEVMAPEAGPSEPPRPGNVAGTTPVLDPKFLQLGTDVDGTPCRQFGLEFSRDELATGCVGASDGATEPSPLDTARRTEWHDGDEHQHGYSRSLDVCRLHA